MKKNLFLAVIVLLLFTVLLLTACEGEVKIDSQSKVDGLPVFAASATRAAKLISETAEEEDINVSFRFSYEDGSEEVVDNFYSEFIQEDRTPEKIVDTLNKWLVSKPHTQDQSDPVEVSGVILSWAIEEAKIASACDFTNDGEWDYVCVAHEPLIFGDDGPFGIETASGKILTIEEVEPVRIRLLQRQKEDILKLDELAELA